MHPVHTLYHYCGIDTFLSLVRGKEIWLSSLSLSNDFKEGRLVSEAIMRLAKINNLSEREQQRLADSLKSFEVWLHGLGFCLSEKGDLLSQWRGYADDAFGVSIGFNREFLEKFAVSNNLYFKQIAYEQFQHDDLLNPIFSQLIDSITSGAFLIPGSVTYRYSPDSVKPTENSDLKSTQAKDSLSKFMTDLLKLIPNLFQLKGRAFSEELEWRLISLFGYHSSEKCLFRMSKNRIIPYQKFKMEEYLCPIIHEVVLGPKQETPTEVVQTMLAQAGFSNVTVRKSDATYR